MIKVEVKNLYKVFGPNPQKILPLVKGGSSKDEMLKTGHTVGVNDVSFAVEEGETFVIMGLSGSGKSTLVRCINRLIEPTAGDVLIDGTNIVGCSGETLLEIRRHKVAMVFQHFALLPHRNVESNVAYGLEIQGVSPETGESARVPELVGLKVMGVRTVAVERRHEATRRSRAPRRRRRHPSDGRSLQRTGPADTEGNAGRAAVPAAEDA